MLKILYKLIALLSNTSLVSVVFVRCYLIFSVASWISKVARVHYVDFWASEIYGGRCYKKGSNIVQKNTRSYLLTVYLLNRGGDLF